MPQFIFDKILCIPSLIVVENRAWMDRGVNDPWTIEFFSLLPDYALLQGVVFSIGPYGCSTITFGINGVTSGNNINMLSKQPTVPCQPEFMPITYTSANSWVHWAFVNDNGTRKAYLNGSLVNSEANRSIVTFGPINPSGSSVNRNLVIGNERDPRDADPIETLRNWIGGVSNFRWTNSTVYTSNFSVPTSPLTALPDTKLLFLQGSNLNELLTDNSGNPTPNSIIGFGANYGIYGPFAPPFDNQGCFFGGIFPPVKWDALPVVPKVNEATVTTSTVTSITSDSAVCGGNVTDDDGIGVINRGVCWMEAGSQIATTALPTGSWIGSDFTTGYTPTGGTGGPLLTDISGILGKNYYIDITITNRNLGSISFSFGSLSRSGISSSRTIKAPNNVQTNGKNILRITPTTTFDGTVQISIYDSIPTIFLPTKTKDGSGLGTFESDLTGLKSNTKYFVRSYATTAYTTSYGFAETFTTLP